MIWLLRTNGSGRAITFRITPGSARTIGRGAQADFIVNAPMVSRLHCRLTLDDSGHLEVEDLGSTNGTFLNGQRVRRAALDPGDRLGVGRIELSVLREPPTLP